MPSDAIYVGRPTKWGNPFKFIPYQKGSGLGSIKYLCVNRKLLDPWVYYDEGPFEHKDIIYFYELWLRGLLPKDIGLPVVPDIFELKGKDLVCWCSLDVMCHTDVLISLLGG